MARIGRCRILLPLALLALSPLAAFAQTASFNLPAAPLAESLKAIGAQANVNVLVTPALVDGKQAPALKAKLSLKDALGRLLDGSGLEYHFINDQTVVIREKTVAANDPPAQRIKTADAEKETGKNSSQDFRVGQVDQTTAGPKVGEKEEPKKNEALTEIVVTGTHIRGVENKTANVMVYDRDAIKKSGYSTVQDLIQSIPQNFRGGDNGPSADGFVGPGSNAPYNHEGASAVNLRGLGSTSTLVLVDGHRVAPAAFGTAVDISTIPLDAIDRIEILADGSSALYGADAVAGVVNFVLRKDLNGIESTAEVGTSTQGGASERRLAQAMGGSWTGGGSVLSLEYSGHDSLTSGERPFTSRSPAPTDLFPSSDTFSGALSGHQSITPSIDFVFDGLFTHSESVRDYNDATQYQHFTAYSDRPVLSADFEYRAPGGWVVQVSDSFSEQKSRVIEIFTPINTFDPGYKNGQPFENTISKLNDFGLKADGGLLPLPAGMLKAAVGLSYRRESFDYVIPWDFTQNEHTSRSVRAEYAEIYIPVIGEANKLPFLRSVDISASIRHERYSDFGSTTSPRIGIALSPIADLSVHASYNTSFRAPDGLEEINTKLGSSLFTFDFLSPAGGTESIFALFGSKAVLTAEKSKNWSGGIKYDPSYLPGFHFAVDYYHIDFTNRIVFPPFDTGALLRPDVYGSLITRFSSQAEANAYLQSFLASGGTFFDVTGTGANGVRYLYSDLQQNAAVVRQSGIDLSAGYAFTQGANTYSARVQAAFIDHILTAFTEASVPLNAVSTYANPTKIRGRADLSWERAQWQLNGAINYVGSYTDTSATPHGAVPAWITADLNVKYRPAWWPNSTFTIAATNILNKSPPYVNGFGPIAGIHYDGGNASPLGRFVSVGLTKHW